MIKLVGVEVSAGTFTAEDGRSIDYDNRVLHCLTDEGLPDNYTGLGYIKEKIKLTTLAKYFKCTPADVDTYLNGFLLCDVAFRYSPSGGKMVVSGFDVVNTADKSPAQLKGGGK
ncbi:MAG: hypothetical protein IJ666_09015 [Ruminococcus sp.]|nr:hypothetical protein [Ruminococcus sp.]